MQRAVKPVKKKFVTIKDIARKAGLTAGTVSLILNGKAQDHNIPEITAQRVELIAKELGYIKNISADLFRSGMQQFVGLIIPDLSHSFFSEIIRCIEQIICKEDLHLVIASSGFDAALEEIYVKRFIGYRFSAIISSSIDYQADYWRMVVEHDIPLILIRTCPPDSNYNFISFDDQYGTYIASKHLIGQGHRHIRYIYDVYSNNEFSESVHRNRLDGCKRAVGEAKGKIQFSEDTIPIEPEKIEGWLKDWIRRKNRPGGIVCEHDGIALNLIKGIQRLGLRVPDDLAIIGFNNTDVLCDAVTPTISSVNLPRHELGQRIGRAILEIISARQNNLEQPRFQELLKPNLVLRESCR